MSHAEQLRDYIRACPAAPEPAGWERPHLTQYGGNMPTPITRTEAIRAAQQTMIDAERRRIEAVEAEASEYAPPQQQTSLTALPYVFVREDEARATLSEVADLRARLAEAHAERDQLAAQLAALRRWVAAMPRQEA